MRITTWNVNGLRAVCNKGLIESLDQFQAQILCLQEIKARPEQLDPEHLQRLQAVYPHHSWNPAVRPGYSGTATFSKEKPIEEKFGLDVVEFDGEGRIIAHRFADFWLFNIYFPNGQRDHGRVPYKLRFYQRLLEICDELHAKGEKVILCGDFNTAHREIDLRHPKQNANTTGFLPEERQWIDTYLSHGMVDVFRYLYPETVQYTWWTYISNARAKNVGWRLDYFLVSSSLAERVNAVITHSDILGSDHCPVTLVIDE